MSSDGIGRDDVLQNRIDDDSVSESKYEYDIVMIQGKQGNVLYKAH